MAKYNLESKVTALEKRIATLEHLSKRFTRKKHNYTEEERAAIRARLLAGQEVARVRREAEATGKPVNTKHESAKKAVKAEKPKKKSEPSLDGATK